LKCKSPDSSSGIETKSRTDFNFCIVIALQKTITKSLETKKGQEQVPDPTSTYEKHTPERVSSNVTNFINKKKV